MTRTIPLKIQNEYIIGDKVLIGATGSHNDVVLRMEFSPMWDGLVKTAQFWDALGESTVETLLTADMLEEDDTSVYLVPVPNGAKKYVGDMALCIKGALVNKEKETRATLAVYGTFTVADSKWSKDAEEEQDVPPTQAEQLQQQIEDILNTILDARKAADDAASSAEDAAESIKHAPRINGNGRWEIWDASTGVYVETPYSAVGVYVDTDGSYGFDVDENGHLRLHYTGGTAPDFALNENGHLILTLDNGQTVDLGKVAGSDYVLTDEDKAEIAGKVPVATAERAGTVKAGTDFDVAADGTLSLYKALTLIANVVPAAVEKGATQTTATVKWATNKTPVSVTVEGESVSPDTTGKELTGLSITAEKEFTVVAADSRGSQTATAVMRFCNGVYTGAAAAPAAVDGTFIRTLTKTLQSYKTRTFTVNAAAGQYIWYACPAGYGTPVFNVGGFDGGFSKVSTLDYTNPSGHTESYQVWRSDNAGLGQTTVKVS